MEKAAQVAVLSLDHALAWYVILLGVGIGSVDRSLARGAVICIYHNAILHETLTYSRFIRRLRPHDVIEYRV